MKIAAAPSDSRRSVELSLVVLAVIVAAGGYTLTSLAAHATVPADLLPFAGAAAGLVLAAHVAVRRLAPRA
ncbi:MAG: FtsW/RodA/SpoVE family cell cycle protein, partial [Actinomycetota bacterium]|nr:FtsW/RodA/SpoVE family cell cycle protein [Actinomycetota bacterium]